MTGNRFGRLVVFERAPNMGHNTAWVCECDCGAKVTIRKSSLTTGATRSCGCLNSETTTRRNKANAVHGACRTPEHDAWHAMIQRCHNTRNKHFPNYGGRGIAVCERWRTFTTFLADMGRRPSPEHSIDRKDNGGDYTPENCRWATRSEQGNNRRTNHLLTHGGRTMTVSEWAAEIGVTRNALFLRLRNGWPTERALQP